MAVKTRVSYQKSWQKFNSFAALYGLHGAAAQLPLSQNVVAMFVAYLFHAGYAANTIRTHLSAIAFSHKISGLHSPSESFLISKMLKGVEAQSPGGDGRYPITTTILHKLLSTLPLIAESRFYALLYCAMCSTAFYAFLRCGEMCASPHNLYISQLFIDPSAQYATITFYHFKHSSSNQPFVIKILPKSTFCPIGILQQYLAVRGTKYGPLFCTPNMDPIPRSRLSSTLTKCLQLLDLSPDRYKIHSFRIGAATTALLDGKTDEEIRVLGRWATTAFRKYLRVSALSAV